MNLTKIVNEINGEFEIVKKRNGCWISYSKGEKISEHSMRAGAKSMINTKLNKEIHLEDLLLALRKNKIAFSINYSPNPKHSSFMISEDRETFYEWVDTGYDLSKPLSNQKPEVINKLIEILS